MNFVLKRIDEPDGRKGQYVSEVGSPKAYVSFVKARRFATRKEAEANRCPDNEVVVHHEGLHCHRENNHEMH